MRAPGSGHADFNSFITAERNGLDVLICTVEEIRTVAESKGLWCTVVPLDSQFRCGGSDAYLRWVVRLLGLEGGGPVTWEPDWPPTRQASGRSAASTRHRASSTAGAG